jgi:transcriptional regulator with XRE-family HTH domain
MVPVAVKQYLTLARNFPNLLTDGALRAFYCSDTTTAVGEPFWTLGDVVRKLREQKDLSQERLADSAGVNKATIVRLENKSHRSNRTTIAKVAKALGVDEADILTYAEQAKWAAALVELPTGARRLVIEFIQSKLADMRRADSAHGLVPKRDADGREAVREKRGPARKSQRR